MASVKGIVATAPLLAPLMADDRALARILDRAEVAVVGFTAEWCLPCRAFEPALAEVASMFRGREPEVVVVAVDVDRAPGATEACFVTALPTLMVFHRGWPVKRFVGPVSAAVARKAVRALLRAS